MKKKKDITTEKMKAMAKERREQEIAEHGKPVNRSRVEKTGKEYTRKKKHKNKIE